MRKTLLYLLISLVFCLSISGCQGAKNSSDSPKTPESSTPVQEETEQAPSEETETGTEETPETDGENSDSATPETPSETPNEPSIDEAPALGTQENPLPVVEDTIFTPPSASLVYLYEATAAGTLSIQTEKAEMLTVKKATENGLETVAVNEEISALKGERFYIFVTNSGTIPLEWCIFFE